MSHPIPTQEYDPLARLPRRKEEYHYNRRASKERDPEGFATNRSIKKRSYKDGVKGVKSRAVKKRLKKFYKG